MNEEDLKNRFKKFTISIVRMTEKFPKQEVYFTISRQIIRCATSPAANYRAACRAKSTPDFINKLKIVEEELDETLLWLEFTVGVNVMWEETLKPLEREGNELLSIIVASIKTSRKKQYQNTR